MTIEICICARTELVEPKGESTQPDVDLFLQDNKHVAGGILHNGTAYINRQDKSNNENIKIPIKTQQLMGELQALPPIHRQALGQVNQSAGSDLTLALASFYEKEILLIPAQAKEYVDKKVIPVVKSESNGILGAGLTAVGKQNSNFMNQITIYKDSLETLRHASIDKQPKAKLILLKDRVNNAHKTLNTTFNVELKRHMPKTGRRGSVWSSAVRGAGLAKGARTNAPINLTSTQEVVKLKNLGKGIRQIQVRSA